MNIHRRSAFLSLAALSAFPIVSAANGKWPQSFLTGVSWSLFEHRYNNVQSFTQALVDYNKEIKGAFDARVLEQRFPGRELDIHFRYRSFWSGNGVVSIRSAVQPTYAEILYRIQNVAGPKVEGQDHHFFEGLTLINEGESMPIYDMHLGS